MSFSVLPLDIERVEVRFGLKLPLSTIPSLLYKDELRINVPSFVPWCQICGNAKIHYLCYTENTKGTCVACNGFCDAKAHNWEESVCNIKER